MSSVVTLKRHDFSPRVIDHVEVTNLCSCDWSQHSTNDRRPWLSLVYLAMTVDITTTTRTFCVHSSPAAGWCPSDDVAELSDRVELLSSYRCRRGPQRRGNTPSTDRRVDDQTSYFRPPFAFRYTSTPKTQDCYYHQRYSHTGQKCQPLCAREHSAQANKH